DPREQLVVGSWGRRLAESADRGIDGQLAGNLAVAMAAESIGHDGDGAASGLFVLVGRVPEAQIVFVMGPDRARRGEFPGCQLHPRRRLLHPVCRWFSTARRRSWASRAVPPTARH